MNHTALKDLISFLTESPTAWHAVSEISMRLAEQDFTPLDEKEKWELEPGQSYFIERGGSIFAFVLPRETPQKATILASHTDSPALKLKPHPLFIEDEHPFLRIETYGSPILHSWLNRDLAIAGRIFTKNHEQIESHLIFLDQMPVIIPSLAIHLDRSINDSPKPVDRENDLCPILGLPTTQKADELFLSILREEVNFETLLGFDLYLAPIEHPRLIGKNLELLSSYRLDNLVSAHASLLALLAAKAAQNTIQMAIFWNHEEIGSGSDEGASSLFFLDVLKRIHLSYQQNAEDFIRLKAHSRFISVDNAHAYHPLYKTKYDKANAPKLGQGVVIKHHAHQKYATSGLTCAEIAFLCQKNHLPYQEFASHANVTCGSTIGPITASRTGIQTVDIGISQLSMHSARELIATEDHTTLSRLLKMILES